MTDKELRTLDEMLTNLEIWSTWNKTFANEMMGICSKMRNLLADRKTEPTISKMEQVDEPQSNADQHAQHAESVETMSCQECKHWDCINGKWECVLNECGYEPQTESEDE